MSGLGFLSDGFEGGRQRSSIDYGLCPSEKRMLKRHGLFDVIDSQGLVKMLKLLIISAQEKYVSSCE